MKKITLSGIIKYEQISSEAHYAIKLLQGTGYKINLIDRFREIADSFKGKKIQVSYYISDLPKSKDEILKNFIRKISGSIEAEYIQEEIIYSSWTSDIMYDETLKIGGHDLLKELQGKIDKYIHLEVTVSD